MIFGPEASAPRRSRKLLSPHPHKNGMERLEHAHWHQEAHASLRGHHPSHDSELCSTRAIHKVRRRFSWKDAQMAGSNKPCYRFLLMGKNLSRHRGHHQSLYPSGSSPVLSGQVVIPIDKCDSRAHFGLHVWRSISCRSIDHGCWKDRSAGRYFGADGDRP